MAGVERGGGACEWVLGVRPLRLRSARLRTGAHHAPVARGNHDNIARNDQEQVVCLGAGQQAKVQEQQRRGEDIIHGTDPQDHGGAVVHDNAPLLQRHHHIRAWPLREKKGGMVR